MLGGVGGMARIGGGEIVRGSSSRPAGGTYLAQLGGDGHDAGAAVFDPDDGAVVGGELAEIVVQEGV